MPDCEKLKNDFIEIFTTNIQREGSNSLLDYLKTSDFFVAPASSRYHGSYRGGLCEHSLDVYNMAMSTAKGFGIELGLESLTIASLLHDLCKVNFYKPDIRHQKIDGVWRDIPSFTIEEKYHFGGHGSKSVFIAQQFIKLTAEEAAAINCHMGFSDDANVNSISDVYKVNKLAWVTHVADEAATYLLER